ncbi:MAG: ketopantoate reductase family protein [Firmicutes bacterium]|nr:ketopantoate reductase family protein [Bacillota bacterium]
MKIFIFGLGALGTVYSCLLKEQGHNVSGLDRETVASAVRERGVRVEGIWGEHRAQLDAVFTGVEQISGHDYDLLILTVKSYETALVAEQIAQFISPQTFILLAQNGYGNFEAAAKFIPPERLILGRVIFGAETTDLGASKVTVIADDVIIGSPANLIDPQVLETFSQAFNAAGIPTRTSSEVMKFVWAKIIYNSALNPLGAILEVPYGKLAENQHTRELMDSVITEIFEVLAAHGQETPWADADAYRQAFYGQMIPPTALHHASMLQDIQRGRQTEIEALNGAVVRLGRDYAVPTPVNRVITTMLKAKEEMSG